MNLLHAHRSLLADSYTYGGHTPGGHTSPAHFSHALWACAKIESANKAKRVYSHLFYLQSAVPFVHDPLSKVTVSGRRWVMPRSGAWGNHAAAWGQHRHSREQHWAAKKDGGLACSNGGHGVISSETSMSYIAWVGRVRMCRVSRCSAVYPSVSILRPVRNARGDKLFQHGLCGPRWSSSYICLGIVGPPTLFFSNRNRSIFLSRKWCVKNQIYTLCHAAGATHTAPRVNPQG